MGMIKKTLDDRYDSIINQINNHAYGDNTLISIAYIHKSLDLDRIKELTLLVINNTSLNFAYSILCLFYSKHEAKEYLSDRQDNPKALALLKLFQ
jgi:hypothetical protein